MVTKEKKQSRARSEPGKLKNRKEGSWFHSRHCRLRPVSGVVVLCCCWQVSVSLILWRWDKSDLRVFLIPVLGLVLMAVLVSPVIWSHWLWWVCLDQCDNPYVGSNVLNTGWSDPWSIVEQNDAEIKEQSNCKIYSSALHGKEGTINLSNRSAMLLIFLIYSPVGWRVGGFWSLEVIFASLQRTKCWRSFCASVNGMKKEILDGRSFGEVQCELH